MKRRNIFTTIAIALIICFIKSQKTKKRKLGIKAKETTKSIPTLKEKNVSSNGLTDSNQTETVNKEALINKTVSDSIERVKQQTTENEEEITEARNGYEEASISVALDEILSKETYCEEDLEINNSNVVKTEDKLNQQINDSVEQITKEEVEVATIKAADEVLCKELADEDNLEDDNPNIITEEDKANQQINYEEEQIKKKEVEITIIKSAGEVPPKELDGEDDLADDNTNINTKEDKSNPQISDEEEQITKEVVEVTTIKTADEVPPKELEDEDHLEDDNPNIITKEDKSNQQINRDEEINEDKNGDEVKAATRDVEDSTILNPKEVLLKEIDNEDDFEINDFDFITEEEIFENVDETDANKQIKKIQRAKRQYILSRLLLQFKVNENIGIISFSFRMYSLKDYPEDLKLGDFEKIYEHGGFSKTLNLPFKEPFELKDNFNKWIARFPQKELRLFIGAAKFQLSNDYWLETNELSKKDWMFLLCKNETRKTILEWGKHFTKENFIEEDLDGIPENYSLFKFLNPKVSHKEIPLLTVYTEKKIRVAGGLKINYRTFLSDYLPDIEIENSDGNEKVFLQYRNKRERIYLGKKQPNYWSLPDGIVTGSDFCINIQDHELGVSKQAYQVKECDYKELSNQIFSGRNEFECEAKLNESYIKGNTIFVGTKINMYTDQILFTPNGNIDLINRNYSNYRENLLLKWLVAKKQCNLQEYNEAFEMISLEYFPNQITDIGQNRASTIYLMDYLGFVDYDSSNKKITALPPKLILMPSERGRKALLIGGRDEKLVNQIIDYCCHRANLLSILIKNNIKENPALIIPDSIILESNNEHEFEKLSLHLNIELDKWYILKLNYLIPELNVYEQFVLKHNLSLSQEDNTWARKVFSVTTLKFEETDTFSKDYSLAEYTYTAYWKEYVLWIDAKCYKVDKSWGRYLVLNHYAKKVKGFKKSNEFSSPKEIFVDCNRLAIPVSLPLPKNMSRVLLQLSGETPESKRLTLKGMKTRYNIYKNIPRVFVENFFRFKLNMHIERAELML